MNSVIIIELRSQKTKSGDLSSCVSVKSMNVVTKTPGKTLAQLFKGKVTY